MKTFYSDFPLDLDLNQKSIFLAGPTPRSLSVKSWRPEALEILEELNYDGQVIVPERKVKQEHIDYITQVEWENYGTENCKILVFWIPRNIETMPAFTTNVEFGRYADSLRTFYGRPDGSPKNRYLDWLYKKFHTNKIHNNLKELLENVCLTLT